MSIIIVIITSYPDNTFNKQTKQTKNPLCLYTLRPARQTSYPDSTFWKKPYVLLLVYTFRFRTSKTLREVILTAFSIKKTWCVYTSRSGTSKTDKPSWQHFQNCSSTWNAWQTLAATSGLLFWILLKGPKTWCSEKGTQTPVCCVSWR